MTRFIRLSRVVSAGFAMFSMFFGAGNVVFPLVVGQVALEKTPLAILGFLLTAVCVPFMGLLAMLFFEGNYRLFFRQLGDTPGLCIAGFIMLLIGPFGALPRCIALSFSTFKSSFPDLSLFWFSLVATGLVFLSTFRKSRIVDILGALLTPFLLLNLLVIVLAGFFLHPSPSSPLSSLTHKQVFLFGLEQGYNTMDLLGSFFFSSLVCSSLKQNTSSQAIFFNHALWASVLGAVLLAFVYIGFGAIGSLHGLSSVASEELLGWIAFNTLGSYAGLVASSTVALACLTTAIALASAFTDFVQVELLKEKIPYSTALFFTLGMSLGMSTLGFSGLGFWLGPILEWLYPVLICLTLFTLWRCYLGAKKRSLLIQAESI